MNFIKNLHEQFVIPVIREKEAQDLEMICLALAQGGLKILEITLMSESAFATIKKLSVQNDLMIGAGTVLTAIQAEKAIDAGAKFLVSPGLNGEAIKIAYHNNIPFIPGVLSPTEVMQANMHGCDLVKIFPVASVGGAAYLKYLRGPFPQLNCMATGGVSLHNLKDYIAARATCVGIGSELTGAIKQVKSADWQTLSNLATDYVNMVRAGKSL